MPRRRSASLELSCSEDLTIAGRRKGLSKAGFYRLAQKVRDALITVCMGRRLCESCQRRKQSSTATATNQGRLSSGSSPGCGRSIQRR